MTQQIVSERPFQTIYIDFIGPYPRSKSGNIGAIVALDHFSKFVWSKPVRSMNTNSLKTFLEEDIFFIFGVPEKIMSDNGPQLTSNAFKTFLENYGITHLLTGIYAPQANAVERVNRNIVAGIRAYVDKNQKNWDEVLYWITWALRSTINQAVGDSPYRILFGQNMISHGSHYELLRRLELLKDAENDLERVDDMKIVREKAQAIMAQAFEKNAGRYNLRSSEPSFEMCQVIYRKNFVLSDKSKGFNAKLAPKYLKARIINRKGTCLYELEDMAGKYLGFYHAQDIRA